MKNLVIVESPNKIKSIEKYLGKDFEVKASVGHIVYLPSSGEHRFGVDIATWTPNYKIDPEKQVVVADLKAAAKKANKVFVATDPDREGEAIADNLVEFLDIKDKYSRIRFNEITEQAVNAAMNNPTEVDHKLVESQVARRILDRIIGYKLSSLMRSKISNSPSAPSAGRVQSIALKLIVEREKEIEAFVPVKYDTLTAVIDKKNEIFAEYFNPTNTDDKSWIKPEESEKVKSSLTGSMTVKSINTSVRSDAKHTPLKQSALYKKADSSLGLSAASVQRAAQMLYEGFGDGGLISYPRTDSTRLSDTFVTAAQKYIVDKYGDNYLAKEIKGTAGAQDAHEAIRPTDLALTPEKAEARFNLDASAAKVYRLIWTHTIQCLMTVPTREVIRYELLDGENNFKMTSSKMIFQGYHIVTGYEAKKELPKMIEGEVLKVADYEFENHETQPPARYNDGSLIEKLDNIKVGRPSTFATTVKILSEREYATYEGRAIKPTEFGRIVISKLLEAFPGIIDEEYTAKMEEDLDSVAENKVRYEDLLTDFWAIFQKDLASATTDLGVTQMIPVLAGKKCPVCGSELVVRKNKKDGSRFFGCSNYPTCTHAEPDPSFKKPFKKFFKKKA